MSLQRFTLSFYTLYVKKSMCGNMIYNGSALLSAIFRLKLVNNGFLYIHINNNNKKIKELRKQKKKKKKKEGARKQSLIKGTKNQVSKQIKCFRCMRDRVATV